MSQYAVLFTKPQVNACYEIANVNTESKDMPFLVERILENRPTLKTLQTANNLMAYMDPVTSWSYQPSVFPYAELLRDLIVEEICACYGTTVAQLAKHQLQKNFAVETGIHVSLPRVYDRASIRTKPLHNVNTLAFQALLYSAAAHRAAKHPLHISCSSGRISLGNIINGAYFQPDPDVLVRTQSNKWKDAPQHFLPPLKRVDFEKNLKKALKSAKLTAEGEKRAELFRQSLDEHPESFSRQVVSAHSRLFSDILPDDIQQVTIDFEKLGIRFLATLLADNSSLTHQLFTTEAGQYFILNGFDDVETAWKQGSTPFDSLEERNGCLHIARTPYDGDLTSSALCQAFTNQTALPKTALLFLVFLAEAGLVPTGGMRQTLYATQIRDRVTDWVRKHLPNDHRGELLSQIPTDRATLTPLWGVNSETPCEPLSYNDVLSGWHMNARFADDLLRVSGTAALKAGAILTNDFIFGDDKMGDEERYALLGTLAEQGEILIGA